ncbi:MAG: hypothetical protein SH850_31440 [Planctomycetaceae bacterium]|nr:hypothetical protein [Planctomycetaceae bacterium]
MTEPPAKRPTAAAHGTVAPRAGVSAAELAQKDSLIRALTEQLEQAAEQLDRFQRSGADRKRGPTGGGMPAELVEEQRQAVGDLQRVVQQWEDMQAGFTLGRIEIQLTELRDFVAQRLDGSAIAAPIERHAGLTVHEESAVFSGSSSSQHDQISSGNAHDTEWDRLKSQLLNGDSDAVMACELRHCAPEEMPESPSPVDVEQASREELQAAVRARDEFIAVVVRRLRATEVTQPVSELVQLGPDAPAFVQRVTELERQLQEHLRLAEVELSLERAKMARDLSQLHQQQELVQKQLKKLGLQSADDAEPGRVSAASNPDRRWARFLGASKGE